MLAAPLPDRARVLVVIVNYRTAELAVRALLSLQGERNQVGHLRAVVVDNASGDGSAERIGAALAERGLGAWARVLASPVNGGFGAGNNLALRPALAEPEPPDYFLLLNPDAAVDPGALATLIRFLAEHPRAGIVGPGTEVGRGNLRGTAFHFPGILNSLDEGLHFGPLTRLLARWQLAPPPRTEAHRTDWLSGGCVLVRRELLEQVGLFDEGFFLYFEEVDLSWRAARAGWESWYVPAARILHEAGASTGASAGRELERRMPPYWFASRRRYFLKNRGRAVCLLADLAWAGGNALWNLRRWLSGAPRKEPLCFWSDFVRFNLLGDLHHQRPPERPPAVAPSPRERAVDVGVVVIARNEGERLERCLASLRDEAGPIVYADSDSSDGSPERARARGVEVVVLDRTRPLNAARGRNAGLARLLELHPGLEQVFFVDGDCEVVPGFLSAARAELARDPLLGAVCGRRRELHPEASFYNRVVDSEWNTAVGETEAFGGDVVVRVAALRAAGGYDEALNQGEDPELAFRLRRAGWRIARIAHEMTRHDVALRGLAAWRKRHQRGGYAYAHGAALHWGEPGGYNQRACVSIVLWGLALPFVALALAWPTGGLSLALFALYGVVAWRVRRHRLALGDDPAHATRYGLLIALGKLDEARGLLRCVLALASGRQALTLEYKDPAPARETRRAA